MLAPTLVFAQYVVVHVVANWSGSEDPRGAPETGLCLGHCSTIHHPFPATHSPGRNRVVGCVTPPYIQVGSPAY